VTSSETSTLKTNEVNKDSMQFPFVFIFPAEGAFWMDNPFCILDGDWVSAEQHEAAELYRDFLLEPAQQDLAVTIGLRPADPAIPLHDPISLDFGTDPRVNPQNVPPLAAVDGDTRLAIIDLFKQTKKKATVMVVLDTSGSMQGDKLTSAIGGTNEFMRRLATEDEIYLYQFSNKVTQLQPSGQAGDVAEQLAPELDALQGGGSTALYRAICEAAEHAERLKQADLAAGEERLYGIVVLSDGMDNASGISLDSLLASCLPSGEDVAGIRVYTIAYGYDADQTVLKKIADQTNGKMFVSDVDNIREIYLSISAEQ
jgi:Ca-activated chloride channel family protein